MNSLSKDPVRFYKLCTEVFNQHVPRKKKKYLGNNKPLMNKILSKV